MKICPICCQVLVEELALYDMCFECSDSSLVFESMLCSILECDFVNRLTEQADLSKTDKLSSDEEEVV